MKLSDSNSVDRDGVEQDESGNARLTVQQDRRRGDTTTTSESDFGHGVLFNGWDTRVARKAEAEVVHLMCTDTPHTSFFSCTVRMHYDVYHTILARTRHPILIPSMMSG